MLRLILVSLWIGIIAESNAAESAARLHEQGWLAFQQHDLQAAVVYFEQASEMGHGPSQVRLGWILDGIGEHQQAFALYRKAAESNHPEGQYFMGEKLLSGEGVEKNRPEAIYWITKAAESGHAAALRRLVLAYENGTLGLNHDPAEAVKWLQHGVARKDAWSIKRFARAYRDGEFGFTVDVSRAAELEALVGETQ